ncbi:MAG TPA: hypothetical protein VJ717_13235 [Gemmatimonadaceae bacterium]|nr:hypothetical protein [Gemmatimonadaceae bacterium]
MTPFQIFRRAQWFAAVVACAAIGACGGYDDGTGPDGDPYAEAAGSYTLVSLNGRALPATVFQSGNVRIDITGSTLVMRENRTFTETIDAQNYVGTAAPVAERQVHNGTYVINGTSATFTVPAAGQFPAFSFAGTLSGNVLTYTDENATYRYERN